MKKDISTEYIAANNLRDKYIAEVATLKMTSIREPGSKADISIQILEQVILDIETQILSEGV